jgi:hypothetical protein
MVTFDIAAGVARGPMTVRRSAAIVVAIAATALLAAVAVIIAADHGVDFAVPKFEL